MPITKGAAEIYYETRGPSSGVPVLLVQGLSWQLIGWREEFCQRFVDRGAYVILYDNRDVGLSQKFGGPDDYDGGYGLADMAVDGVSVLEELGLASAHVVGASMGGMIAQEMAVSQPSHVRSLNLIYTAPAPDPKYFVQQDTPDLSVMAQRLDRAGAIEKFVEGERASASTAYPYDEEWVRELGSRMYDRGYAPAGVIRQIAGISRWSPAPEALGRLELPVSIIHGRADRRISADAALDLGRLFGTSEMHIYPGLGHEIPEPLWDEFVTIMMRTVARAEPQGRYR
jgi:pimeloyl-ACP methyl ester carboxylesterase